MLKTIPIYKHVVTYMKTLDGHSTDTNHKQFTFTVHCVEREAYDTQRETILNHCEWRWASIQLLSKQ